MDSGFGSTFAIYLVIVALTGVSFYLFNHRKKKNDTNKLFGNVGERNKVMFTFVALFLQICCKSL